MNKEESSENEFLKELSPLLFEKRIVIDSDPPTGYFEDLSDKINVKIKLEDAKKLKQGVRLMQFVNIRNLSIAAGFAVLIALIPFFRSNNIDPDQTRGLVIDSDTEIAELNEYIEESDLYGAFDVNDVSTISVVENLNEDEIINYLITEDYNEDLLIEMR